MKSRRFTLGVLAVAAGLATAVNSLPVPAAIAEPTSTQQTAAISLQASAQQVKIGQQVTITATFPQEMSGRVAFYLDGVRQSAPVAISGTTAAGDVTVTSYGDHTVTARFFDAHGYNPLPDATLTLNTAAPQNRSSAADLQTDEATDYAYTINGVSTSLENPQEVKPLQNIDLQATFNEPSSSYIHEVGINLPSGFSLVGDRVTQIYHGNEDSGWTLSNHGTSNDKPYPDWGQNGAPDVTSSYAGTPFGTTPWFKLVSGDMGIRMRFEVPENLAPGIYVPELMVYKYRAKLHLALPMTTAAFKIPAVPLPARKVKGGSGTSATGDGISTTPGADVMPTYSDATVALNSVCRVRADEAFIQDNFAGSAKQPLTPAVVVNSPNFVRTGEEFTVTLAPQPMEVFGEAASAKVKQIGRLKLDFALPDPAVAEVEEIKIAGEGQGYSGNVTIERLNEEGQPDPHGTIARLSGDGLVIGNGVKTGTSFDGLVVNPEGRNVMMTLPKVEVKLRATGVSDDVAKFYVRTAGDAGVELNDKNWITGRVKVDKLGTHNLSLYCLPVDAVKDTALMSVLLVDANEPVTEETIAKIEEHNAVTTATRLSAAQAANEATKAIEQENANKKDPIFYLKIAGILILIILLSIGIGVYGNQQGWFKI